VIANWLKVTNVPRSLASAVGPLLSGVLLQNSLFGWPLICAGAVKSAYDLILFATFSRKMPERADLRFDLVCGLSAKLGHRI